MHPADFHNASQELDARYKAIRRFELKLPQMLQRADWPKWPEPGENLTESDLLFAKIFLRQICVPGCVGPPLPFPLTWLYDENPLPPGIEASEEDRIACFLGALAHLCERAVDSPHELIPGEGEAPDDADDRASYARQRFPTLRGQIADFPPLIQYKLWLGVLLWQNRTRRHAPSLRSSFKALGRKYETIVEKAADLHWWIVQGENSAQTIWWPSPLHELREVLEEVADFHKRLKSWRKTPTLPRVLSADSWQSCSWSTHFAVVTMCCANPSEPRIPTRSKPPGRSMRS